MQLCWASPVVDVDGCGKEKPPITASLTSGVGKLHASAFRRLGQPQVARVKPCEEMSKTFVSWLWAFKFSFFSFLFFASDTPAFVAR